MKTKNKKPHILICAADYLPRIGGAEIAVQEITDQLESEFDFSLITPRLDATLPERERVGAVSVYRVGFDGTLGKLLFPFIGVWQAKKIHTEKPITLLWGIMASWGGILGARLARILGLPFVLTVQEGDEEEHLMRYVGGSRLLYRLFVRPWYLLPIKKADTITAISTYLRDRVCSAGAEGTVVLVPNGANVGRFKKGVSDHEKQLVRQSLGVSFDARILLNVSRLVEKNNVADTITALTHLPNEYHLVVLGDGFLREQLIQQAKSLGVDERVHLVGRVEHGAVPAYLAVSDMFVRTPHSEGFGNVFIEAMAAGVPVIATPVGGIPDFLVDPRTNVGKVAPTGIFAEPGNPKSIADAVQILEKKRELRDKIVRDARQLVVEKYDWSRIAEMMKKVFSNTFQIRNPKSETRNNT